MNSAVGKKICSITVFFLILWSFSAFANFKVVHEQEVSPQQITQIIEKYRPRVESLSAGKSAKIFLSGGSALAILNAVYDGKVIKMRDMDFFVIAGGPVDLSDEPDAVNEKTLKYPEEIILTEFFFFEDEDKMNYQIGLLDVDKMKIEATELVHVLNLLESGHIETLKETRGEWLYDPLNAFQNWRDKTARLSDVFVKSFYSQAVLRVSRSFAKMGVYSIPERIMKPLRTLDERTDDKGLKKWFKGVAKILSDKSFAEQIKNMSGLNIFDQFPALNERLQKMSLSELKKALDKPSSEPELQDYVLRRLVNLAKLGSDQDKKKLSELAPSLADKILN